ncbi:hypothetical protein UFOVP1313_6 [uncultured Caudovirales phage]|uniref:Uncharacterized protein n=1 Tax=uncultured Caudovirales phage TaxID=2100421 RepID=A0A6J5RIK0_9CAUD|nr:hypothetical protein UFOVP1313_6 [uncultured Caudovirales phage]
MPKRTIAVLSYATLDGKSHDRGQVVDLSDEEIRRGSKLRAFAEDYGKDATPEPPKPPKPQPVIVPEDESAPNGEELAVDSTAPSEPPVAEEPESAPVKKTTAKKPKSA